MSDPARREPHVSDREDWRPVVGFEGRYEVSSHGRVRGIGRRSPGRPLAPHLHRAGYYQVGLYQPGRNPVCRCIHQLVAGAFLGTRPLGKVVCHNDGTRTNNRLGNLRYDTPAENSHDMIVHGNHLPGERNPNAVLTDQKVRQMRRLRTEEKMPYRAIARQFGVAYGTVQKVLSGESWCHVE